MFFARQDAPDPARSALRSLRPSMNTPVVVLEDLPAGPATAVIAGLGGPEGSQVSLAIRSVRSGQVIFFGPDDERRERPAPELALDAALSFAESMGFLFDDDRLAAAPAEAGRLWESLLEAAGRVPERAVGDRSGPIEAPGREPPEPEEEELWLDRVAAPGPPVGRLVPLTKFRSLVAGAAGLPRGAAARPPLARLRGAPDRRSS